MKFADPLAVRTKQTGAKICFAGGQLQGAKQKQEDYLLHFSDQCFVVTDGVGSLPFADVAAQLAAETAIWAYKLVRERPFYWDDKKLFLKRIFRSVNMSVWQKRKEYGFEMGIAATLALAIVGEKNIWVGTAGDTSALLYREGLIDELTLPDVDPQGNVTKALGMKRLGMIPTIAIEKFLPGDILLLLTDGVSDFIEEDQMRAICEISGSTNASMAVAVERLLDVAQKNGSTDNMTAYMIKKVSAIVQT